VDEIQSYRPNEIDGGPVSHNAGTTEFRTRERRPYIGILGPEENKSSEVRTNIRYGIMVKN